MIKANSEISWKSAPEMENLVFWLFHVWMDGKQAMFLSGMKCPFGTPIKNCGCVVSFEYKTKKPSF